METQTGYACQSINQAQKNIPKFFCAHGYQPALVETASQVEGVLQEAGGIADQLLSGIEIIQAIQSMNLTVPLIGDKPTLVRAYLKHRWPFDVKIGGAIRASWRANPQSSWISRTISSANFLKVMANATEPLNEQRKDLKKSLNFYLPDIVIRQGECRIHLERLEIHLVYFGRSFKFPINIPRGSTSERTVQFQASAPLRLHMIGIRYQNTAGRSFEPSGTDYSLIQSWLKRAYPIANLSWSLTVIDAPQLWPFQANMINAFIRGIRRQDIQNGTDARTHYYGLVSDGEGFMRGLASGIPNQPDPATVASGPTGPNWSWDTDGSFGDWYTGHELGHTLGRFHAEFCGAGGGRPYPFENGQLSDADEEFIGYDAGDPSNNIPQRMLPGTIWHDVMSYCDNQWLSSFTYEGIYDRLVAEDNLPSGASLGLPSVPLTGAIHSQSNGSIHVLATINLTRKSGNLQHVIASQELSYDFPSSAVDQTPDLKLKLYRKDGQIAGEYFVNYFPDLCLEQGEDETGIVDVVIPSYPDASSLELLLNGETISTFTRSTTANAVQNIRQSSSTGTATSLAGIIPESFSIEWTDNTSPSEAGFASTTTPAGVSYVVQISKDKGETWQTAGYGQNLTTLEIDSSFLEDLDQIQVKVISTDGFTSQITTQTLDF